MNPDEVTQVQKIDKKIKELQKERKLVKEKMEKEKMEKKKEQRLKTNGNGKSNVIMRVANIFASKADKINEKRIENGYERLSNPKITELIIRHKGNWPKIEEDLIFFNTEMKEEQNLYV